MLDATSSGMSVFNALGAAFVTDRALLTHAPRMPNARVIVTSRQLQ
jgi:hypothetical protein